MGPRAPQRMRGSGSAASAQERNQAVRYETGEEATRHGSRHTAIFLPAVRVGCYYGDAKRRNLGSAMARRKARRGCFAGEALRRHPRSSEWVFSSKNGTSLSVHNLHNRYWKPLLKDAGLPDIRFHDLRHACATLLLSKSVHPKLVQELLGHSSIEIT